MDFEAFKIPDGPCCAGLLKPDVAFFGENVPFERVAAAMQMLARSDAMLVVYSGCRFAQAAGTPISAVSLGKSRADELLTLKVTQPCATAPAFLLAPATDAA